MSLPAGLYVVGTPIGNLEDITLRALRVLGSADTIAAEDTRRTRKLCSHYGIRGRLLSCNSHSPPYRIAELVSRMCAGQSLALVTDAGTPGISDPGGQLVRAAIEAGQPVWPIPGPSSLTAALSVSGLPSERFVFEGFPPRGRSERRRRFRGLAEDPRTLVLFESPNRIVDTLTLLHEALGGRVAVAGRELTKQFEEVVRGDLSQLLDFFQATPPKGEFVVIVEGAPDRQQPNFGRDLLHDLAERLLGEGLTPRDVSRRLVDELGVSRREAYAATLKHTKT